MAASNSTSTVGDFKIPVVDFGKITGADAKEATSEDDWKHVATEICKALSGVGFVYLSNHGISEDLINNYFNASKAFFTLPEKTKICFETDASKLHGFNSIGRERLDKTNNAEYRESFYMKDSNGAFPDEEVPLLRPLATSFISSCTTLARHLLTALALGLGLERDFFVSAHQYMSDCGVTVNSSVLRINYYPPLPSPVPANAIRCGAHSDYGSITLLFQDSMGGLQVRSMDGQWVDAKPIPGTILINAGDLLQIWTAGRVVATEHRVIIPTEEVRLRSPRLSAAFFVHPDCEVLVKPIDGSSSPPPITARQHLLNMYSKTYKY